MALHYNIVGATSSSVELIAPGVSQRIKSILFTNVHNTADATVTLFIEDSPSSGTSNKYNIIHTIDIPAKTSLLLDNQSMLKYESKYGLYVEVGSTDTIDIMIGTN
jgi:hypothetical protein